MGSKLPSGSPSLPFALLVSSTSDNYVHTTLPSTVFDDDDDDNDRQRDRKTERQRDKETGFRVWGLGFRWR